MKYLILICSFFLYSSFLLAKHPQKIYPLTRQNLALSYYQEQATLWKIELDKNTQNKEAWFNYFMANKILSQKEALAPTSLQKIMEKLQQSIPNTFEAYFAEHAVNQSISALLKAYTLAPNRYETYIPLIEHYQLAQELDSVEVLCHKWLASGEYSTGILQWNYNAIIGLAPNAILLTEGDNQTYPLWLLQYAKKIRQDVQVLNLDMLGNTSYKNLIFNKLELPNLETSSKSEIVQHLVTYVQKNALYFGISIPKDLVQKQEEQLFIVGLSFRHSNQKFDNISVLVNNYENHFLLDYLKINLAQDISQDWLNQNNVNYLPSFLVLYDYYKEKNDWAKADYIKDLCFKIADAAEKGEALRDYLNGNLKNGSTKPLVKISHREIEDSFVPLAYSHNLYAATTEVSNEDYERFLTDLLKRKEFDQLQAYKIYKTDWRSYLSESQKNITDDILFEHGKPDAPKAPIQNISYESALAYCEWLTAVYNNQEHKKKKFKRVVFRLPTDKEWQVAASTLSPNVDTTSTKDYMFKYPWKAYYHKNSQGCFLANFNTNNEAPCETCPQTSLDGAFFTAGVDSYFPNEYGLYNTIGNVAEMIQEKGKTKGGSWFHTPNVSTIQGIQTYDGPEPYIGFRVFMEVLEEGPQDLPKKIATGPPGTLHLKGKLYLDETELSNIDWLEYMYWMKKNDSINYSSTVPDTTVWLDSIKMHEPFAQHYFSHPTYYDYPVIGISYEQAKNYCAWRTARVNEMLALTPSWLKKFGQVLYRLPTEAEWEYAANGGLDQREFPYGLEALENSKGLSTVNILRPKPAGVPTYIALITSPIRSYIPNKRGFYNMIGNAAEIVQEEGFAKGGSWSHTKKESNINNRIPYTKPSSWLGFRCICETNL